MPISPDACNYAIDWELSMWNVEFTLNTLFFKMRGSGPLKIILSF